MKKKTKKRILELFAAKVRYTVFKVQFSSQWRPLSTLDPVQPICYTGMIRKRMWVQNFQIWGLSVTDKKAELYRKCLFLLFFIYFLRQRISSNK